MFEFLFSLLHDILCVCCTFTVDVCIVGYVTVLLPVGAMKDNNNRSIIVFFRRFASQTLRK